MFRWLLVFLCLPLTAQAAGLTVFAAASLTNAIHDIGVLWQAKGHKPLVTSFESSAALAQQIERGAPADLFLSADEQWMDDAAAHRAIVPSTRLDLVGNDLVLIEPAAALKPVKIARGFDLAAILGPTGRLALGDPASVPAGLYAKQALTNLGIWPSVEARLAPAENVRAALLLVERGEAPAGIVYATDARVSPKVGVAGTFPPNSHDPIRYPAALTRHGMAHASREARAFLAFLQTPDARDVFTHYGFTPLAP